MWRSPAALSGATGTLLLERFRAAAADLAPCLGRMCTLPVVRLKTHHSLVHHGHVRLDPPDRLVKIGLADHFALGVIQVYLHPDPLPTSP
jgi:hypothetical protein